jgi:hypothetical protein
MSSSEKILVLESDSGERRDLMVPAATACGFEEKNAKVTEKHRNNFNVASGFYRIEAPVPDVSIWLSAQ